MDQAAAQAWASEWVESWNSHDLSRVLSHFAADAEFSSPLVPVITSHDNPLRGRDQLRAYWSEGLRRLPGLRFSLRSVYLGARTIAISYGNDRHQDCLEVLELGDHDVARRGWALYRPPAGPG